MSVAWLAAVARSSVAVALIATAIWKVFRPVSFEEAFRAIVPAATTARHGIAKAARGGLVLIEVVLGLFLLLPGTASLAALAAAGLIVAFSVVVVVRAPEHLSCGCWRDAVGLDSPALFRTATLVRNAVLVGLAAVGSFETSHLGLPQLLFAYCVGLALAALVLEIPQATAVARFHRTYGHGPVVQ